MMKFNLCVHKQTTMCDFGEQQLVHKHFFCILHGSHYNTSIFYILLTTTVGPMVECSPGVRKVMGPISGCVIPKTLKMVLGASLLDQDAFDSGKCS